MFGAPSNLNYFEVKSSLNRCCTVVVIFTALCYLLFNSLTVRLIGNDFTSAQQLLETLWAYKEWKNEKHIDSDADFLAITNELRRRRFAGSDMDSYVQYASMHPRIRSTVLSTAQYSTLQTRSLLSTRTSIEQRACSPGSSHGRNYN